jgi:hypothetical protein
MALTLHGTVSDNTVALDRKTATPLIINGDMQIAQKGTSKTGVAVSGNPVAIDRFKNIISSLGTWTVSQSTDVPTGQGFTNSFKMDCTTAEASPSAASFNTIAYRFEGQNLQMLKKGTSNAESVTVSFWVKATKTGTNILELYDFDNLRQISQAYTIDSANTWEKKVLSFAGDTTGTIDNDNAFSFQIQFWLGAGSNRTSGTLNTSWATITNANRVVGQVNHADSTSNELYITGVQLEVGSFDANSIPPFQFEDRGTSLARCQRYTQVFGGNNDRETLATGCCSSSTAQTNLIHHLVQMRTTPSLSVSDVGDWRIQVFGSFSATTTAITISTDNSGVNSTIANTTISSNAGSSAGRVCHFKPDITLDARLILSAEL